MVCHKAQDVDSRPRTKDIVLTDEIDFKSMMFPKPILEGLLKSGYRKPSPIQRKALPLVRCGLDLIVQAKAGTGKTLVLAVAALETVQPQLAHLQAIVLAPTREIALQVHDVINAVARYCTGLKCSCFIGGYPLREDTGRAAGCQVAVGAPGRVSHLLRERMLDPRHVRLFVLDEADKLLEDAFVADIDNIYAKLPSSKQVLALSATYTAELIDQLGAYMRDGRHCSPDTAPVPAPSPSLAPGQASLLLGVRQFASVLSDHSNSLARLRLKEKHLLRLLASVTFDQCFVFSNLHSRAASMCNLLNKSGLSADWLAGRQEQAKRLDALDALRSQRIRVLVTTDLAARGIDAEHVNLVVNLDVPHDGQTYLHRMGRAGRYGAYGIVITIVHSGEELEMFQKVIGSIGGSSMSVSRVPSNLDETNLWTTPKKDLKQIRGTVFVIPTNDVESELENAVCNGKALCPQQIVNMSECGDEITGRNSEINAEENNCSGSVLNEAPSQNCNAVNRYKCNISTPYVIDKIFRPSLFSVAGKEDGWRDILPIVINESSIPLNVPITLLGSEVVRVKRLHEKLYDHNHTGDDSVMKTVKFESNTINTSFLTYDEIKQVLVKGVNEEINTSEALSFETVINLLENEPGSCEQRSECDDNVALALSEFALRRKHVENQLISFDHFDLVGWMAADDSLNVLDDSLQIENCDVYKFELTTCPDGVNHITPVIPKSVEINEKSDMKDSDLDRFIVGLNLEDFDLHSPYSLTEIAEKITLNERGNSEGETTNLVNGQECETFEYCNGQQFKNEDGSMKTNIAKENSSLELNKVDTTQLNNPRLSDKHEPSTSENFFYRSYKNYKCNYYKQSSVSDKSETRKNKYQDERKHELKGVQETEQAFEMKNCDSRKRYSKSCKDVRSNRKKSSVAQRLSEIQQNNKDCSSKSGRTPLLTNKYQQDRSRLNSSEETDSDELVIHNEQTWKDLHDYDESDTGPSEDIPCSPMRYKKINGRKSLSNSSFDSPSYSSKESVGSDKGHNKSKKYTNSNAKRGLLQNRSCGKYKDASSVPLSSHKEAHNHVKDHHRKQSSQPSNNPYPFHHPPNNYTMPHTNNYPDYFNYGLPEDSQNPNYEDAACGSHPNSDHKMPQTNRYPGFFSYGIPEDSQNPNDEDADCGSENFPEYNFTHGACSGNVIPNERISSENLARDWYSKWYVKVRQRAQQLEYSEYITMMAQPYW